MPTQHNFSTRRVYAKSCVLPTARLDCCSKLSDEKMRRCRISPVVRFKFAKKNIYHGQKGKTIIIFNVC